jgi:hypothetical protein
MVLLKAASWVCGGFLNVILGAREAKIRWFNFVFKIFKFLDIIKINLN